MKLITVLTLPAVLLVGLLTWRYTHLDEPLRRSDQLWQLTSLGLVTGFSSVWSLLRLNVLKCSLFARLYWTFMHVISAGAASFTLIMLWILPFAPQVGGHLH